MHDIEAAEREVDRLTASLNELQGERDWLESEAKRIAEEEDPKISAAYEKLQRTGYESEAEGIARRDAYGRRTAAASAFASWCRRNDENLRRARNSLQSARARLASLQEDAIPTSALAQAVTEALAALNRVRANRDVASAAVSTLRDKIQAASDLIHEGDTKVNRLAEVSAELDRLQGIAYADGAEPDPAVLSALQKRAKRLSTELDTLRPKVEAARAGIPVLEERLEDAKGELHAYLEPIREAEEVVTAAGWRLFNRRNAEARARHEEERKTLEKRHAEEVEAIEADRATLLEAEAADAL